MSIAGKQRTQHPPADYFRPVTDPDRAIVAALAPRYVIVTEFLKRRDGRYWLEVARR